MSERLRRKQTTPSDSTASGADSVDWRECPGIEVGTKGPTDGWVFKGTQRSVAELLDHIAEGGSTHGCCELFPEVQPADTAGLLKFLVNRLQSV